MHTPVVMLWCAHTTGASVWVSYMVDPISHECLMVYSNSFREEAAASDDNRKWITQHMATSLHDTSPGVLNFYVSICLSISASKNAWPSIILLFCLSEFCLMQTHVETKSDEVSCRVTVETGLVATFCTFSSRDNSIAFTSTCSVESRHFFTTSATTQTRA